jgi:hypothetical protein
MTPWRLSWKNIITGHNTIMAKQITLFDIFITVLERNGNDATRNYIRKTRILMNVPECAEYLNCILINALGTPCCIAEDVVDKAVDCVIHLHEDDIECFYNATQQQKETEKTSMKTFMEQYRCAVKDFLKSQGLLK